MGKGTIIAGTLLGVGAAALAFGTGAAAASAGPRSVVTTTLKVRRGVRERWRGVLDPPPPELAPSPKFKPGQRATLNDPDESVGSPTQGKTITIKERVYYEPVSYAADAAGAVVATPLKEPGSWAYVTDLVLDGQPVLVAERVLYSK